MWRIWLTLPSCSANHKLILEAGAGAWLIWADRKAHEIPTDISLWKTINNNLIFDGDGVSLKTPRPRGWVGAGRPSGCKSSFNKRNMYQYPHVSQLFILLPWQSRVYPEPLKVVEFVQLTTECCWGQPSDPCQRGCLTSHACVMWGPRTLNADDDDDDDWTHPTNHEWERNLIS